MIVIGLTGSIGTGKSTVTGQFRQCGAATLDSDKVVHRLLGRGGAAVAAVERAFPGSCEEEAINRSLLGAQVFGQPVKRILLERIIHPLVREAQERFIRQARHRGKTVTVLDVPLLFETGGERRCDVTVVTTAPYYLQRLRVLRRADMTEEKFQRILAAQMPDAEKRRRGDHIVPTGLGLPASLRRVKEILAQLAFEGKRNRGILPP